MAGLTDMEELVAAVDDKDVADYLREALACYGTGAYRACVVLTHIALFDGLRRKVKIIAPVNAVAKAVSEEIEKLATSQKVFETPLIHKLKGAGILTDLESDILERLNGQRNKAAHASGHKVTAEEARFVFSEAIQKFLSLPLRETSYVVQSIMERIGDENFFPSQSKKDRNAVVDEEVANLDPLAAPFLISKLAGELNSEDAITYRNANNFLVTLAAKRDQLYRKLIVRQVVNPLASSTKKRHFTLLSILINCDPQILSDIEVGTRARVQSLLLKNANNVGLAEPYQQLRHPASVFASCIRELGEDFVLENLQDYTQWVLENVPQSPEFIQALVGSQNIVEKIYNRFLSKASSADFGTSNNFAEALPDMDAALALVLTDGQSFRLLAATVRGADCGGFSPGDLAKSQFKTLPELKKKAKAYAAVDRASAKTIMKAQKVEGTVKAFVTRYLA